jgi:sulfur-carrier protein
MDLVEIKFYAAAREAAGVPHVHVQPDSIEEIIASLIKSSGELARVLPQCSYLIDEVAVRDRSIQVKGGSRIDVLPQFAGG